MRFLTTSVFLMILYPSCTSNTSNIEDEINQITVDEYIAFTRKPALIINCGNDEITFKNKVEVGIDSIIVNSYCFTEIDSHSLNHNESNYKDGEGPSRRIQILAFSVFS